MPSEHDERDRVSRGGEGRIRRVTPEEQRAMQLAACEAGRSDIATQEGWDLSQSRVAELEREKRELEEESVALLDTAEEIAWRKVEAAEARALAAEQHAEGYYSWAIDYKRWLEESEQRVRELEDQLAAYNARSPGG